MENNSTIQALADRCAREHGYICASYRGCSNVEFVFEPLYSNSEHNPTIPTYILVTENGADYVQGFEYQDVLDGIEIREFTEGRRIYDRLYRKFQEKNFECDENNSEESEEHSIVISQMMPKPWIAAHILYDYLEVAERLEMKACLYPNKERIGGNQNWIYHIELT